MGGRKSRNKGANFERAIANDLREWLGDEWTIKRNPTDRQKCAAGSGEFEIVGPQAFPFSIECKAHETFDYSQLFRQPTTGPFESFWEQACSQADASSKKPMLILKRNNGPTLVAVEREDYSAMMGSCTDTPRMLVNGCAVMPATALFSLPPSVLFELS